MDYITKTLGVPVIRTEWKQQAALPFFLNDRYTFEQADIGGVACLIVHPVGELDTINTLKSMWRGCMQQVGDRSFLS